MALLIVSLASACTARPSSGASATGGLIFEDNFTNPSTGWSVIGADQTIGGKYNNGSYDVWTNDRRQVIVNNSRLGKFSDFTAEVSLKKTSGLPGALYGIVYRFDDAGHYYRFAITDNRTWVVGRMSNMLPVEEMLVELQSSDFIKPGNETNVLKVVCLGENQDFYINGSKLWSTTDNTSLNGEIGLMFSNWTTSAGYSISDFKLYKP